MPTNVNNPNIEDPWSIQPEFVEGCNFRCWFCGIHAIRGAPGKDGEGNHFKYMDKEVLRAAFREMNIWLPKIRVEVNNHGEPTVHPDFWEMVEIMKTEMPSCQVQLQTNGYLFFPPEIQTPTNPDAHFEASTYEFFKRGGNLLVLNCYKPGTYAYAMAQAKEYLAKYPGAFKLVDFYYDNPDNLSAYRFYGNRARYLFVLDDLGAKNVDGAAAKKAAKWIDNEAGNVPQKSLLVKLGKKPLTEPRQNGCTRPFREITMGWDGSVPVCCYDWSNQLLLGKFPEQSLQSIWEGEMFTATRTLLDPKVKERHMAPCNVCDLNGGFRIGLIKDPQTGMSVEDAYATLAEGHARLAQETGRS